MMMVQRTPINEVDVVTKFVSDWHIGWFWNMVGTQLDGTHDNIFYETLARLE